MVIDSAKTRNKWNSGIMVLHLPVGNKKVVQDIILWSRFTRNCNGTIVIKAKKLLTNT